MPDPGLAGDRKNRAEATSGPDKTLSPPRTLRKLTECYWYKALTIAISNGL